jgi:hypothetical protein
MAEDRAAILFLPIEVLVHVLQSCHDFEDVISLALSCKLLNATWESHAIGIIGDVAKRCIIAFDEALLAVSI